MPRVQSLLTVLTLSCLLAASTVHAGTNPGLDRLNGRWKLDWSRSDSVEPLMVALEVPWVIRRLAGVVSVHVVFEVEAPECEGCSERLRIVSENPIKNTTRLVVLEREERASIRRVLVRDSK